MFNSTTSVSRETIEPYYAGIGARSTPPDILKVMEDLAVKLSATHILRSGGAEGADSSFAIGAGGRKVIFRPEDATPESIELASKHHRMWKKCEPYVRRLHGRNSMIILGADLKSPVKFVICWTETGKDIGGTGVGIRIAEANGIPVVNLHNHHWLDRIRNFVYGSDNLF